MNDEPQPLLTDTEAARWLRMLRTRVVRLARKGEIPCVLLPDGEIRFLASDLAEFVARHHHPVGSAK